MTEQFEYEFRGDEATIGLVVEQSRPLVSRFCRALVGRVSGDWAAADCLALELLPQVVSTVVRDLDRRRPLHSRLTSALHRLAMHDDRLADLRPTTPMAIVSIALGPPAGMVLWLRVIEGLSGAESARALGLRIGEVQLLQRRAVEYLGKCSAAAG